MNTVLTDGEQVLTLAGHESHTDARENTLLHLSISAEQLSNPASRNHHLLPREQPTATMKHFSRQLRVLVNISV